MKTFDEVFNEIKGNVAVSKSGKVKKTFSKADYDRLLKALLNDTGYKTEYCTVKGGEMVTKEVEVTKMFRESIKRILINFGVDKQEAEKMVTDYQFTNVDGWYELAAESIYKYIEAGKKYDFPTRQDFKGSLTLKEVDESTGTFTSIRKKGDKTPPEEFKIKTKKHKVLEKKSKAPAWLKKKFK